MTTTLHVTHLLIENWLLEESHEGVCTFSVQILSEEPSLQQTRQQSYHFLPQLSLSAPTVRFSP